MDSLHFNRPAAIIAHFINKHRKHPGITKIQLRELAKSEQRPDPSIIEAIKNTDFYKNEPEQIPGNLS